MKIVYTMLYVHMYLYKYDPLESGSSVRLTVPGYYRYESKNMFHLYFAHKVVRINLENARNKIVLK